jgi:hypothetical protein
LPVSVAPHATISGVASSTTRFETAQELWAGALGDVVRDGEAVPGHRPTHELLGHTLVFNNVRRRVLTHPVRRLNIMVAVARFVWMMAGSDRFADIFFYESKVENFTDDGVIIPGSDYGARLRATPPGLDQVRGAIERLKPNAGHPDEHLRRAMNVIWRPEDAVRPSNDIPCAALIGYLPRDGKLEVELVLRSSNAVLLLPFNLFEFSLLAETVAVSAGLEPGAFSVHAMSLHVYDEPRQRGIAETVAGSPAADVPAMPPMPADEPLTQLNHLIRLEAGLRHDGADVATANLSVLRERAEPLNEYWRPFFEILLIHHLLRAERLQDAAKLAETLPAWAERDVQERIAKTREGARRSQPVAADSPRLWDDGRDAPGTTENASDAVDSTEKIRGALRQSDQMTGHIEASLEEIAEQAEITYLEGAEVKRRLLEHEIPIAARSEGTDGQATDFLALTVDDVLEELRQLRASL